MTSATSRRAFLQTAAVAGTAASLAPLVHAAGSETLKVGLIGCGGRGRGAAEQALKADPHVRLHAIGDAFSDQLAEGLNVFKNSDVRNKVDVAPERAFVGLDAYKKVIDCCDVVLLTSPPHFRPDHLTYAVSKGRNVFTEKPMAVDVPGYFKALRACEDAKKKNLSVVSGFCWRYQNAMREAFKRVHDGQVGDVLALECVYNASHLRTFKRKEGWSDMEYQLRNWLHHTWLSGDHIVEQAVHSIDKMNWAMKNEAPIKVIGQGGRQARRADSGQVWDHFGCVYEWANGVRMFHFCRQIDGTDSEVNDWIRGTKGTCFINASGGGKASITGENKWVYDGPFNDMYQTEHDELFASIRKGKPINDSAWMLQSTLLAIAGRMAAYTGKTVKWADLLKSEVSLTPKVVLEEGYKFGPLPTPKVAVPGKTKLTDNLW